MSTCSKTPQPKLVDKPTAWACTLANIVTVPGLGTIASGRKIGFIQVGLSLVGFGLSIAGTIGFMRDWRARGEYPEGFTSSVWMALVGVLLFGAAWLWALRTSIRLHKEANNKNAAVPEARDQDEAAKPPTL